jgi:hypothetical protein
MRVYRIEHESKGHGPYIIPFSAYECNAFCEDECEHDIEYDRITSLAYAVVGAHQDRYHRSPQGILQHEVCGFDSMHALEAWFDGFLGPLLSNGYTVAEFEGVNVHHHGNGQVTFHKELSIRLTSAAI